MECLIKGADLQVIVVENDRGEEEALMELGPPVAVTGLMVKFLVLMMVMVMTSGTVPLQQCLSIAQTHQKAAGMNNFDDDDDDDDHDELGEADPPC